MLLVSVMLHLSLKKCLIMYYRCNCFLSNYGINLGEFSEIKKKKVIF